MPILPSTLKSLMTNESFQGWLSNTDSAEENKQWSDWLKSDPRHREIYREALELWQLGQFKSASLPDVNQEWKKLQHRLNLKTEKSASIIDLSAKKASSRWEFSARSSWLRYGAIAAALLLIFLTWHPFPRIMYKNSHAFQTISTEYGQRVKITLPEGTTIILNANSTLHYPTEWTEKTLRQFKLQGEAYFIVTSNPRNKFIVTTNDGKVQVTGTRFAVYERGLGTRVAVEDGHVEVVVTSETPDDVSSTSVLLKSGDMVQFQEGNQSLNPQSVNILVYTSWWSDQLVFDNSPFKDIVGRLKETYGVNIEIRDDGLLKRRLSGSIENTSLQIITEALAKALQVPVHREGKIIIFGDNIDTR